jgi:hypothetical protein
MVGAVLLAVSPCGVIATMIWKQRRWFERTRQQIRALPEIRDAERV